MNVLQYFSILINTSSDMRLKNYMKLSHNENAQIMIEKFIYWMQYH